jgi:hypothetical protein
MDFDDIINRIKKHSRVKKDKDVAGMFDLSPSDFTKRKQRGSLLPFIVHWAVANNVNLDWLIKGDGAWDGFTHRQAVIQGHKIITKGAAQAAGKYSLVPLSKAELNAGSGAFVLSEGVKDYYSFETTWLEKVSTAKKNLILTFVKGDSMSPTIKDGDLVMIDLGRRYIAGGCIYALRIQDTIHLKKLSPMPGGTIQVISDNKEEYPPYSADQKDVYVIGQVIWFCRQLIRE